MPWEQVQEPALAWELQRVLALALALVLALVKELARGQGLEQEPDLA